MCKECKCDRGFVGNKVITLDSGRQLLKWNDSSVFLFYTSDNHLVFGSQFRAGSKNPNERTLGTFGGYLEKDESYHDAFIREMYEETSIDYDSEIIKGIDCIFLDKPVSAGYTSERSSGFIAVTHLTSEQLMRRLKCNDDDEDIKFEDFHMKYILDAMIKQECSLLYKRIDDLKAVFLCYGAITMYGNNLKAELNEVGKKYVI